MGARFFLFYAACITANGAPLARTYFRATVTNDEFSIFISKSIFCHYAAHLP
jgi:hypothetical protein